MGSDKAFIRLDGVPLVRRSADVLNAAGALAVTVIGGDANRIRQLGLDHCSDDRPGAGPLAAVGTAMSAAMAPVLVVVAVDLVNLDAATVRAVVAGLTPGTAVAVAYTDRRQPLCAAWNVSASQAVLERVLSSGATAMHAVLDQLVVADVEVPYAVMTNANTPDDLRRDP